MVNFCAAAGCSNRGGRISKDYISFHRFPLRNKTLLKKWLAKLKRADFTPGKRSTLCSEHFEPECIVKRLVFPEVSEELVKQPRRTLHPDAVPTLFAYNVQERIKRDTARPHTVARLSRKEKKEELATLLMPAKEKPATSKMTNQAKRKKHTDTTLMENTDMSDLVVIVIQPTTDNAEKKLIVTEYTKHATSRPPSSCNVPLQCDTMLENTDKDEVAVLDVKPELQCNIKQEDTSNMTKSLDVKTSIQHGHVASFCQNKEDSEGHLLADDIIKTEHFVEDNNVQTVSLRQIGSNISVKHIVNLDLVPVDSFDVNTDVQLDINTNVQPDHLTSFCQNIKVEKTDKDEQGLMMPLGITTEVAVLDVKPELQCNIKQEDTNNSFESSEVKTDVRHDFVSSVCQNDESDRYLLADDAIITEQLVEDNNVSLHQVGSNVAESDVQAELQCFVKQENISHNTELSEVKSDVQSDDKPGYLSNQLIFKPEHSEDITSESATLEDTWQDCKLTGNIEKCIAVQPDLVTSRNPEPAVESLSTEYIDDTEGGLINNEHLSDNNHVHIHTVDKPLPCPHCDKQFSCKNSLFRHMKTHTGQKPHSCPLCDKRFSQKCNLTKHIRIHNAEKCYKPLPCPHCDQLFSYKGRLLSHMKTHPGEKPFPCPHCDIRFNLKNNLSLHLRIHTGEKPFSCPHCDKRFSMKKYLSLYSKRLGGKRPYACPSCYGDLL